MKPNHLSRKQKGVSLVVTLMITVLLSLLALYGAGVLILDTRSAANDYRYREAMSAAESGVEQGFSLLNANRANVAAIGAAAWQQCTATTAACLPIRADQSPQQPGDRTTWKYMQVSAGLTTQPSAGAGSYSLFVLTPASGDASGLIFNIVAIGNSADGSSSATVKQGVYFYPLILGNVDTPLAAASNIPLSGNYSIITNSNGGGSGVPVSAWSNSTITPGGSFSSCHKGEFDGSVCPSTDALSKSGLTGPDMVGNDPNFPPDLFQFLFGTAESDYQKIKDQATVAANCNALDGNSEGLIWITGDCNTSAVIGSAAHPVLLVVEGDVTMNAGDQLYGLLYLFDPAGSTPTLKCNGNAHLHGAIMAHDGVTLQLNGGFVLEYDEDVLKNLKKNPSARALARISGSWSDVQ